MKLKIGECAAAIFGAVLLHGARIGEHSVIGASSNVFDEIEAYKVAYGTPARVIRERTPGDKYL